MKRLFVLLLVLPLLCHTYPLDDTSSGEDSEIAESEQQIAKRSGGLDLITHLKSGILSSIGKASASLASGSSGGSSGYKSIDSGHGNSVEFDPWSLKKSVLNTIFQAVKAITGGVTALKGQLIKGSGYALSAGGKLVAASGDKVTDVGKSIINSAQLSPPPQSHGSSHPFSKLSSLSGGSSGGGHNSPGPVVHTETITTYEIPAGHHNYGPPSKPPSFSSATHQYLPSQSYSGGAPFANHAAFEAPSNNYVPSKYGPSSYDGHEGFNIYGRHTKLSEKEARKAADALQEILHLLPGKTKPDKTKTATVENDQEGYTYPDNNDYTQYDTPLLGPVESVSHTESITAAYGPPIPHKSFSAYASLEKNNPSDIYHQMANRQKDSGSDTTNHAPGYKYPNPHRENSFNSYPPTPVMMQNIVKSTSVQVNLDPRRPFGSDGGPVSSQQSKDQRYVYFNPAQNRVDVPFDRRRYTNLKPKFQYIKDSRITNAAMFNRNLMF